MQQSFIQIFNTAEATSKSRSNILEMMFGFAKKNYLIAQSGSLFRAPYTLSKEGNFC